ncbi:Palmitoyltransferase [Podila humilis]|nr:Palmitoyltransferase [Podila humilis]
MLFTGSRYIVAGVTLLIAFIALTSQLFVFIPWFMHISLQRTLLILVPFNTGVAFIYWHYYLACTTEPGSPPPGWGVPQEEGKTEDNVNQLPAEKEQGVSTAVELLGTIPNDIKHTTGFNQDKTDTPKRKKVRKTPLPRYCRVCEGFKPPRSHHCRICKKCVLKMDHHCPWINNCVGHFNYGHFIRFITWVTITTGACMALLCGRIWDAIKYERYYMYHDGGLKPRETLFLVINIFVDGGVLLAVGILCITHLWSMMSNTSTIEVWEKEKVEGMIKKGKIRKTLFPYDVGCMNNYRQVLGPWMLLWLWPQNMLGTGTEYEVITDKDAAKIWPPRDYQTSKRQDRTFVSEYSTWSMQRQSTKKKAHEHHLSSLDTPASSVDQDQHRVKTRGASASGAGTGAPPHFPTHVRRGSEGWVVQALTVQQRVELYDQQQQFQREFDNGRNEEDGEEDEYQEGFSDIEGDTYSSLLHQRFSRGHEETDDGETSSSEYEEIPYDVASDEYDDNYDEYEDYNGGDDDFDEHNPYLAYSEGEETESEEYDDDEYEDEGEGVRKVDAFEVDDDEVTLRGRDRHKIGRFFEQVQRPGTEEARHDDWDEGEGVEVGCRPPMVNQLSTSGGGGAATTGFVPGQKTFYDILVEREQSMKLQKGANDGLDGIDGVDGGTSVTKHGDGSNRTTKKKKKIKSKPKATTTR